MLLSLGYLFIKIGLFCFGGGYVILPFLEQALVDSGMMSADRYMSMVALSQITPGPIAVNASTFVGFDLAGLAGAAVCTVAVSIPAFVLVILAARFFKKYEEHPVTKNTLKGIRAVTVGLMFSAVWSFVVMAIFDGTLSLETFNIRALAITVLSLILSLVKFKKVKFGPVSIVIISGILGIILL